ncbi:MAG: GTP 3',8-cyclase MoaA [Dehalococcoidia bacterium]|nr:GTP 3',8-cyclase MoaA [Dehalococcoidia bacterium]
MDCLSDSFHRPISYLRVSVTDRCNLRCLYCVPPQGVEHIDPNQILSYEEIIRVIEAAQKLGISKVRVTGGEPLVRSGIVDFIRLLSSVEGIQDVAMTTNGVLLKKYARALRQAGLSRVNVSLDTLRPDRFREITRGGRIQDVLDGLAAAEDAGLSPIKINAVAMEGFNQDEVLDFGRLTIERNWHVRFIELMPMGQGGLDELEAMADTPRCVSPDFHRLLEEAHIQDGFLSVEQVKGLLAPLGELEPWQVPGNGPARYYRLPGARGTLGFISPVSEYFCSSCNRLRLTADGRLRPCLLAEHEIDLRETLRSGAPPEEIESLIRMAIASKPERHLIDRNIAPRDHMVQIGG